MHLIYPCRRNAYPFFWTVLLSAFASGQAFADCDNTGNPIQISSSCNDLNINSTVTGVSVDANVRVTAFLSPNAVTIGTYGNVTSTFLNEGTITNGFYHNGLVNNGTVQTLLNKGSISSTSHDGLGNNQVIGTLTNSGNISSGSSSDRNAALVNNNQIGTLNNAGTISATTGNWGQGAFAILQAGHIGTLNNTGTISAQNRAISFQPAFTASIDTLNNSGTIQGGVNGGGSSTFASAIVLGVANSIGTIINTGTIDHSVCSGGTCYAAIENQSGSIGTITNLGNLTSGNTADSGYGIINSGFGRIGTLNNAQTNLKYYGNLPTNYNVIINSPANYGKLDVTSAGTSTTNFGIAAGSTVASGTTTYTAVLSGMAASNLVATNGTYGGGGLAQTNWTLKNVGGGSVWDLATNATPIIAAVSGSSAGTALAGAITVAGNKASPSTVVTPVTTSFSYTPTPIAPPTKTTDTVVRTRTTTTPTSINQPTTTITTTYTTTKTTSGTSTSTPIVTITTAATPVAAAVVTTTTTNTVTTTEIPSTTAEQTKITVETNEEVTQTPNSPKLVNGVDFSTAYQALTPGQAQQLSSVHAEGYSSNMTIGLEQMGHITNTVMDRIHNPMSNRGGTSTAYEMDQGKYLWIDAAAVKGTVNSYDNLAGFGYNLYDSVIGGDVYRDSSGGVGLYAGVGYTSMSEPAQVSQNFNTTNYYAGVYGGKYLPYNFKLSGALGYIYGETNASRNNPNVGLFTGGTANSNYNTNGAYGAFKFSRPFQATESLTLTPYIGASYSQLWMGQAKESGGGDFSYNISNATAYTTVTFVGGEFIMPLTGAVKNPMSLVGFYRFGYDWFANSAYAHSITATNSLFGSFNQVGADMGPALNLGGLGVQGNITKSLSGRIGVVGSANTNGWQIGGGGELKWAL